MLLVEKKNKQNVHNAGAAVFYCQVHVKLETNIWHQQWVLETGLRQ
jgi:hypothetical protein